MRDIVLHRKQVIDRPVVTLRPDVAAGSGFDELGGHANPLTHRLDAALENIFHVEVATYLSDVDRIALIDPGGIPSDDDKVLGVGEISNDVLGDPICEPLPFWIVPNIVEGQNRNRRLIGQRRTGVPALHSPETCRDDQQHSRGQHPQLMPTDFGHVGMFPEHAMLWNWMKDRLKTGSKVLNLFAYTGGATFAAAQTGAEVCHVDASKVAVAWARENCALNNLEKAPIRWIVDDVVKFLQREVRRGNRYDGIVLDPPTFGRGSKGEVFKIEKDLPEILKLCFLLKPSFVILSCHTPGYTPLVLNHLLKQAGEGGTVEAGELVIPGPLDLASGTYARWYV